MFFTVTTRATTINQAALTAAAPQRLQLVADAKLTSPHSVHFHDVVISRVLAPTTQLKAEGSTGRRVQIQKCREFSETETENSKRLKKLHCGLIVNSETGTGWTMLASDPTPQSRRAILFRRSRTVRAVQSGVLLADDRIVGSLVDVDLRPVRVVLRYVGVGKNRFDRTLGHTRIAIDASLGVYVKTIRQFVKCFDGTDGSAVSVLAINTRFGDDVGHSGTTPFDAIKCLLSIERNVNKKI
jgi:hypothetical protein